MWPFLARVDAAVGEDAGAQHVLREAASVGLSPVARGSADDPHDGLHVQVGQSCLCILFMTLPELIGTQDIGYCDYLGTIHKV